MPRVILTGGPGVGKTTLLRCLASQGYAVVEESSREVIREQKANGLPARPDPKDFAHEVLRRDRIRYNQTVEDSGWTFFDRSPLEAVAMLAAAADMSSKARAALIGEFTFYKLVFVLPPWPAIYVQDAERDHTFEHCTKVHEEVVSWYSRLGYQVAPVPLASIQERASHVIQALAASGA